MQVHSPSDLLNYSSKEIETKVFYFTYVLPYQTPDAVNALEEKSITDDKALMHAINMAFSGPDDSNPTIKFLIHEQPPHITVSSSQKVVL